MYLWKFLLKLTAKKRWCQKFYAENKCNNLHVHVGNYRQINLSDAICILYLTSCISCFMGQKRALYLSTEGFNQKLSPNKNVVAYKFSTKIKKKNNYLIMLFVFNGYFIQNIFLHFLIKVLVMFAPKKQIKNIDVHCKYLNTQLMTKFECCSVIISPPLPCSLQMKNMHNVALCRLK